MNSQEHKTQQHWIMDIYKELYRPITSNIIEQLTKNISEKESSKTNVFTGEFYRRKIMMNSGEILPPKWKESNFSKLVVWDQQYPNIKIHEKSKERNF